MDANYQVMPELGAAERAALKASIKAEGVKVPVEYDENGAILDGYHRVAICQELGVTEWPRVIRAGMSVEQKVDYAYALNMQRRHMNVEQKRSAIEGYLRRYPHKSDRQVATAIGVDHKTVATVRAGLSTTGEIPQLDVRTGADGKARRQPRCRVRSGSRAQRRMEDIGRHAHPDLHEAVKAGKIPLREAEHYVELSKAAQKRLAAEEDAIRRQKIAVESATRSRAQRSTELQRQSVVHEQEDLMLMFTNSLQRLANALAMNFGLRTADEIASALQKQFDPNDPPLVRQFEALMPLIESIIALAGCCRASPTRVAGAGAVTVERAVQ